ncbi:hypothetical protein K1T35_48465 (plasmid) [Pseudonocardia sp. DSM 110487]|uniref:hypothetical protein n=1 Tax=Pseudonocardia sp. DSM 110487 TaxID=2865833 RepID=UPI001C6A52A6|nr:hypothetical protein [Pseudonocardia sp. DSM 110487]QYN41182.1 hypothetical protein K1T35_48465 [Pseudonocardia sp. DSM 110487]
MSDMITPPAGAETYTDVMGKTQWRVTGTDGRVLVTRAHLGDAFEVWRPDSLNTIYRDDNLQRALDVAHRKVNPEH